jgi:toxin ParE1/3/4
MKRYILTRAAQKDLKQIWKYSVENWNLTQADIYMDDILDTCQNLASGRKQGKQASVHPGYMKCAVGSHIIYYRVKDNNTIIIVRILHGRMDADRRLH